MLQIVLNFDFTTLTFGLILDILIIQPQTVRVVRCKSECSLTEVTLAGGTL